VPCLFSELWALGSDLTRAIVRHGSVCRVVYGVDVFFDAAADAIYLPCSSIAANVERLSKMIATPLSFRKQSSPLVRILGRKLGASEYPKHSHLELER
jgi:hypothetical protein